MSSRKVNTAIILAAIGITVAGATAAYVGYKFSCINEILDTHEEMLKILTVDHQRLYNDSCNKSFDRTMNELVSENKGLYRKLKSLERRISKLEKGKNNTISNDVEESEETVKKEKKKHKKDKESSPEDDLAALRSMRGK